MNICAYMYMYMYVSWNQPEWSWTMPHDTVISGSAYKLNSFSVSLLGTGLKVFAKLWLVVQPKHL